MWLQGMEAYGVRAFAEALEVIPSTLAENAGLDPISIVTQLRNRHAQGESAAGINVRKVRIHLLWVFSYHSGIEPFPFDPYFYDDAMQPAACRVVRICCCAQRWVAAVPRIEAVT